MARAPRQSPDPVALESALLEHPESFDFFEAIRRIECAYPESPRMGESTKSVEDPVRLCHTPSLTFAPRMLDRFEKSHGGQPARLHGLFFGLFGPNAPLPLHLTEYAIGRQLNSRDNTFTAFANIFHHRMMGLFYRAWAAAQPTVQYDRPEQDRFGLYVGALVGLATPNLADRDALPDRFKRFFVGRLQQQARNAEGLVKLLQDYFRIAVCVIEFVGEWMPLPASSYLRLGTSSEVASLGLTAVTGEYVWGTQQRFRLRIGPLSGAEFNHFLPGGVALEQLVAAVKFYVGEEKSWDVQLVLRRDEVPAMQFGKTARLGLTSWIGQRRHSTDADHVVLTPAHRA